MRNTEKPFTEKLKKQKQTTPPQKTKFLLVLYNFEFHIFIYFFLVAILNKSMEVSNLDFILSVSG